MTIIKTKTNRIFVPSVLQNSPVNPETDFLIVMRSIDKLDKFFIDRSDDIDENLLAKCFTTRSFSFITSDASERRNQLKNDLRYDEISFN